MALVRRYQQQLNQTARQAGRQALQAWNGLGTWDEVDVERLAVEVAPTMEAARQHGAALAAALIGIVADLGIRPVDLPALDPQTWRAPFLSYWSALKTGTDWQQAHALGGSRAETAGFDTVQSSSREASQQIDSTEPRIVGWERVLTGVSCEWCATVATQRYHTAESASFGHNNCDCTIVPITGDANPGRVINHGLLSSLNDISPDDRTGYVNPSGDPTPRPAAAPA